MKLPETALQFALHLEQSAGCWESFSEEHLMKSEQENTPYTYAICLTWQHKYMNATGGCYTNQGFILQKRGGGGG